MRIRYAFRSLAKSPLLSLVVVISLGLGIGANTAIFSLLDQMVLRSLPVREPGELAVVEWVSPKTGSVSADSSGGSDFVFSYPAYRELEKRASGVAGLAAFRREGANLAYGNQTVPGSVMLVSGSYFPLLGVKPLAGRTISPDDDREGGGNPVAVVSYRYWNGRLGADLGALNRAVRINGQPFTIVGIAPREFRGTTLGNEPDVFAPLSAKPIITPDWKGASDRGDYWLYLFARLQPGGTRERAAAALNGVFGGMVEEQAKTTKFDPQTMVRFRQSRLKLIDGRQGFSTVREQSRTPILALMLATCLVLAIAMANAANLLLARSAERRKELAIRTAMGAGRGEIALQMLTEAVLLAAIGGLFGLAFHYATLQLLVAELSTGGVPPDFVSARLEWPALLYALGVSAVVGVVFGLYPAWEAARSTTRRRPQSGIRPRFLHARRGARAARPGVRPGNHFRHPAHSDRAVSEEHGEPAAGGPGISHGEGGAVLHLPPA